MKYLLLAEVVDYLKSNISFAKPFVIKRLKMPKNFDGDCSWKNSCFLIRIEKSLPEHYAIDVALHEIGHVLSWEKDADLHGPNWGNAYSLVYRTYLEWLEKHYRP